MYHYNTVNIAQGGTAVSRTTRGLLAPTLPRQELYAICIWYPGTLSSFFKDRYLVHYFLCPPLALLTSPRSSGLYLQQRGVCVTNEQQ